MEKDGAISLRYILIIFGVFSTLSTVAEGTNETYCKVHLFSASLSTPNNTGRLGLGGPTFNGMFVYNITLKHGRLLSIKIDPKMSSAGPLCELILKWAPDNNGTTWYLNTVDLESCESHKSNYTYIFGSEITPREWNIKPISVEGTLSQWSFWSKCSMKNIKRRNRSCENAIVSLCPDAGFRCNMTKTDKANCSKIIEQRVNDNLSTKIATNSPDPTGRTNRLGPGIGTVKITTASNTAPAAATFSQTSPRKTDSSGTTNWHDSTTSTTWNSPDPTRQLIEPHTSTWKTATFSQTSARKTDSSGTTIWRIGSSETTTESNTDTTNDQASTADDLTTSTTWNSPDPTRQPTEPHISTLQTDIGSLETTTESNTDTTNDPASAAEVPQPSDKGVDVGVIVGAAVAGVVLLIVITVLVLIIICNRKRKRKADAESRETRLPQFLTQRDPSAHCRTRESSYELNQNGGIEYTVIGDGDLMLASLSDGQNSASNNYSSDSSDHSTFANGNDKPRNLNVYDHLGSCVAESGKDVAMYNCLTDKINHDLDDKQYIYNHLDDNSLGNVERPKNYDHIDDDSFCGTLNVNTYNRIKETPTSCPPPPPSPRPNNPLSFRFLTPPPSPPAPSLPSPPSPHMSPPYPPITTTTTIAAVYATVAPRTSNAKDIPMQQCNRPALRQNDYEEALPCIDFEDGTKCFTSVMSDDGMCSSPNGNVKDAPYQHLGHKPVTPEIDKPQHNYSHIIIQDIPSPSHADVDSTGIYDQLNDDIIKPRDSRQDGFYSRLDEAS